MTDWGHIIEIGVAALVGSVPVILYIASNKKQAREDTERRHKENTEKLDEIIAERNYLPPHGHIERTGPLEAEGIFRKPNGHL
jgi:glutamate formiminotransferase